jgi:hypothetical protein
VGVLVNVYCTLTEVLLNLTEVFPCFFLSCKASARVKLAKTGHGPHSTTLVICVVWLFVLFYVLFVCKCLLPSGGNPITVNKYHIIYMQNVNQCSMHSVHVQLISSETRFSCRFILIGQLVHLIIYFVGILIAASRLQCKNGSAHVAQDYSDRAS